MHSSIIIFLILLLTSYNESKKEFFYRDNIYELELNVSTTILTSTTLRIYAFIGRTYIHPPSTTIPPNERTNVSYLYGVKFKDNNNIKPFGVDGVQVKINQIIERSIYVHPNCNKCSGLVEEVNNCNGPPTFVAIFSTGIAKKSEYLIRNLNISTLLRIKKDADVDRKSLKNFSQIFHMGNKEYNGSVDILNYLKIKNNKIGSGQFKKMDPVDFILMNHR